jgi:hypothetical protein
MVQMLWRKNNPDIAARAQIALDEAIEVAGNRCIRINGLQKRLEFLKLGFRGQQYLGRLAGW